MMLMTRASNTRPPAMSRSHTLTAFLILALLPAALANLSYSITSAPRCVQLGHNAAIGYSVSGGSPSKTDWISLYPYTPGSGCDAGTCPSGAPAWDYLCGSHTACSTTPPSSGTVTISVASGSSAGVYRAYYLLAGGYTVAAQSGDVVIQSGICGSLTLKVSAPVNQSGLVNVSWSGAPTGDANDWLVFTNLAVPSGSNYISGSWAYTYGGQAIPNTGTHPPASGWVVLTAPATTGSYAVWYCENNGYTCPTGLPVTVSPAIVPTVTCGSGTSSEIEQVVLVISENHSFDSIYGSYCSAATGSNPTCTTGPACCEAAPAKVSNQNPKDLTDAQNLAYSPDHSQAGEVCEIDGGAMDKYVSGCSASSASNWALADHTSAATYWRLAGEYAIADRFFQSAAGASCQNDMYFITGHYMFTDNDFVAQNSSLNGDRCYGSGFISYYNPTILDLFNQCGLTWRVYAEGWAANPSGSQCYPDYFDATDIPASYYPSLTLNPGANWADYSQFASDVANGQLPAFSIIKGLGIHSEHPADSTLTAGQTISAAVISNIIHSAYNQTAVVFLTPDESGGFYDHIRPPANSRVDSMPYGPRTPLVAAGWGVKTNYVSHVQAEPSSIIRFLEWNWLAGQTGQLGARDGAVNNLGDLFNATRVGTIPSD